MNIERGYRFRRAAGSRVNPTLVHSQAGRITFNASALWERWQVVERPGRVMGSGGRSSPPSCSELPVGSLEGPSARPRKGTARRSDSPESCRAASRLEWPAPLPGLRGDLGEARPGRVGRRVPLQADSGGHVLSPK